MSDGATTEHNQEEGPWQKLYLMHGGHTLISPPHSARNSLAPGLVTLRPWVEQPPDFLEAVMETRVRSSVLSLV